MSNITEEIEKLSGIMSKFGEAHNMLAKTSLSKEEYQPISGLLAKAKVELFNFCNDHKAALQNKVSDMTKKEIEKLSKEKYPKGYITSGDEYRREGFIQGYKAALQNKVSDISAEGILDKYYKPKMHWKVVNRKNVLAAMHEYASIVNCDQDRINYYEDKIEMLNRILSEKDKEISEVNERKDNVGNCETSNEVLNEVLGIAVKAHLFQQLNQMDDFIEEIEKFKNFEIRKK
jgi:hypothetical protein